MDTQAEAKLRAEVKIQMQEWVEVFGSELKVMLYQLPPASASGLVQEKTAT